MYDLVVGYLRFTSRYRAYALLIVDDFPPFDGAAHPHYPVRVDIGAPAPQYSRLKAFFRLILAIPIFILQYVLQIWTRRSATPTCCCPPARCRRPSHGGPLQQRPSALRPGGRAS